MISGRESLLIGSPDTGHNRIYMRHLPIVVLLLLCLFSCKKEVPTAEPASELTAAYISSYTSSVIGPEDAVQVFFAKSVIELDELGSNANPFISVSPGVSGEATWTGTNVITFEPREALEAGREYLVTVYLDKLFENVPEEAERFSFNFRTRPISYRLTELRIYSTEESDLDRQPIRGTIRTEDPIDADRLEKLVSARFGGRSLNLEWTHDDEGIEHRFMTSVRRGAETALAEFSFDGTAIGAGEQFSQKIEIPAKGSFKLISTRAVNDEESRYYEFTFSDPLQRNQPFEDYLVPTGRRKGGYRFVADGNLLRMYPELGNQASASVRIEPDLKNVRGDRLGDAQQVELSFEQTPPLVRMVRSGTIIPGTDEVIFPFEAINVSAVEVEVFKIFGNNVFQFLQNNELGGNSNLRQVGRIISQERHVLSRLDPDAPQNQWHRYALDLHELFRADPHAMYKVRIGFRPEDALVDCETDWDSFRYEDEVENRRYRNQYRDFEGPMVSIFEDYAGINGRYEDYSWRHRDDPCKPAYYNDDRFIESSVLASNLGIVVKGTEDELFVAVSDLRTTDPVNGAEVEVYDYQNQLIRSSKTDGSGMISLETDRTPFLVMVKKGDQRGFMRLMDGEALSLSRFEVEGAEVQEGMKGLLYGERGVWRPGDSLHLFFMLESDRELPADYPISFTLKDNRGTVQARRTVTENIMGLYGIPVATEREDPTGIWQATVEAGGARFTKNLRIETVKPNRLKIRDDLADEIAGQNPAAVTTNVTWLHGAVGRQLEAIVEAQLRNAQTEFEQFREYKFTDPARRFDPEPSIWFEGETGADGRFTYVPKLNLGDNVPGKLTATVRTRVFERGGDFSTDVHQVQVSPYESYVGVQVPTNQYGGRRLDRGKDETIRFAVVDAKGNPARNQTVEVGLYQTRWYWWWDDDNSIAQYNQRNHRNAKSSQTLTTDDRGIATMTVNEPQSGSFLVRACIDGGHCSGDYFYVGYPYGGTNESPEAAMLSFSTDKESYQVGETVTVRVPAGGLGRALMTLEDGQDIRSGRWYDVKQGKNEFSFTATAEMAPTVYIGMMLVQPHGQTANDLPIRLYGVVPVEITDPSTELEPQIALPEELAPKATFAVEVSESEGRAMAYSLMVVDEGLLDLTRHKTPAPHDVFYAREALGVQTWDVYDDVLGAYGGQIERILSVGGDDAAEDGADDNNANRFEPVVRVLGPFQLKKGATDKHSITLPNYVGSVRTMVVAMNDEGRYGHAEATTPVRQPLMVLATLPRVLGPGETLRLPVNVFAMDDKMRDVQVSVRESSGRVEFPGGREQALRFGGMGDQMANFDFTVGETVGVANFVVTATGAGETATQEIEIDVRNPNPEVSNVYDGMVRANDSWQPDYELAGVRGTNSVSLEVSNLPPIGLEDRLRYLIRYPYGCLEQTVSGAFPQLYVNDVTKLDPQRQQLVRSNVQSGIDRMRRFVGGSRGFSYWPGSSDYNSWANNYAGHFLLSARDAGYLVPSDLIRTWKASQQRAATDWQLNPTESGYSTYSQLLNQAYRLYTLALAGSPDRGAMNRLRERSDLPATVSYRLATAYALTGKKDVARQLIEGQNPNPPSYRELGYNFGSNLRDMAMNLETLVILGETEAANKLLRELAKEMNERDWMSTQETAFCLLAIGKFAQQNQASAGGTLNFAYTVDGTTVDVSTDKPIYSVRVPADRSAKPIRVRNPGNNSVFARLVATGQPLRGAETPRSDGLTIDVTYTDREGKTIDPTELEQGTDFVAVVTVRQSDARRRTLRNLALEQVFPSGWEIQNTRMADIEFFDNEAGFTYRDYRDDRVHTFFDLYTDQPVTYFVGLTAAYEGRYYLPATVVGAMYDKDIEARNTGQWVEVVRETNQ